MNTLRSACSALAGAMCMSASLISAAHAQDGGYEVSNIPAAIAAIGTQQLDCYLEDAVPAFGFQKLDLADGATLYTVPCQNGDVNIESYLARLEPDSSVTLFAFAVEPGSGAETYPSAINPEVLKNGLVVQTSSFYGPDANCGVFDIHELNEDGTAYTLVERREKPECSGDYAPPQDYPVVWSAR